MYSRNNRNRSKVGSVQIKISNNRLQLVFRHGGKRHYISTGFADTPLNRKLVQEKAFQIQRDIEYGEFDPSYERYKLQSALTTVDPVTPIPDSTPTLAELWTRYVEIRQVGKSPSTLRMYDWVANHISRCPHQLFTDSQAVFDWLTMHVPADSTKRLLTQFSSCCRWAKRSGLIDTNPFDGMASEVKLNEKDDEDIEPFTREERDRIIATFQSNRYYKYYTPLVRFLFQTGCRPSEALALQWKHINQSFIQFEQAVVYAGRRGNVLKKGLKTQEKRKFPINAQLAELLQSIKPAKAAPDALVFPSRKDKIIDWHNFSNRAWKTVLASLPEITYRNPYQTRHTFCSLCREENVASIQIAKWVGNSPEMIDRIYARPVDQVQVPIL
ncbi:DUF3596 domain-containing protein [Cyanobacteria bacterium FACHB-63]|nr:DUF3596 domain-containing protein [Cyanobacteria bacterium FACHB-63]